MPPSFTRKPSLYIYKINVDAQNIDSNKLKTYRIVIALFQADDKDKKSRFFEKTFLFADIYMDVAFGMLFIIFSNVEVNLNNQELK